MFIDIHSHIVPDVDDGSESFDESCDIIRSASSSGTSVMVATPHFNNPFQGRSGVTKKTVLEKYSELKRVVAEEVPSVTLFLGSELLVRDNIHEVLGNNEFFSINGSRYLLVEFAFDEKISNVKRYIEIIMSFGIVPVIAHPERYLFFENSYEDIYSIAEKGCLFQINKDSPLGKYGEKANKLSRWFIKNELVHCFAGDCHGVYHRNADMTGLYEWLINYYPVTKINSLIHDNPKRILLDMNI